MARGPSVATPGLDQLKYEQDMTKRHTNNDFTFNTFDGRSIGSSPFVF
jgi:hypothetical protein